jgi:chloramphenicol O-acetyltransferase
MNSTLRRRDKPKCEVYSKEALKWISFRASSSKPIVSNKDKAISPIFTP